MSTPSGEDSKEKENFGSPFFHRKKIDLYQVEVKMNELNNDWVLIGSILAIVVTSLVVVIWGWKTFRNMGEE